MAVSTTQAAADQRTDKYRAAEENLWRHYGLAPQERFVEVARPNARLRVTEVGEGPPLLFIGGTGGTGPYWGALLQHVSNHRCLIVDRPGFGLSDPVDYAAHRFDEVVAQLVVGVLDGLDIAAAPVVGASIGNAWALHAAHRAPDRVKRIVLLGGGPLTSEIKPPRFVRMLRTPVGALIVRIPEREKMLTGILRGIGHGASLDAGRIPPEYLQWHMSLTRNTRTMHEERDMVRAIVARTDFRPGVRPTEAALAATVQPVLMVYGSADDVGTVEIWQQFVQRLPSGSLEVVDGGGHLPWLDDPAGVGASVERFLAA